MWYILDPKNKKVNKFGFCSEGSGSECIVSMGTFGEAKQVQIHNPLSTIMKLQNPENWTLFCKLW